LSFFNSADSAIVSRLAIPVTTDQLEQRECRYDSMLFKMLAKCLIMWEDVMPTRIWLEAQLPPLFRDPSTVEFKEQRPVGSDEPASVDWLQILQGRVYAIAGLALAVGLKFAGSRNSDVKLFLLEDVLRPMMTELRWPESHCAAHSASRPSLHMRIDRRTIETCRSTVILAASVVMSGSGDVDVLRYARALRILSDENSDFGACQAVHTAIGFLFLGGGKLTFQNTPEAIACILPAVLPRFPTGVGDQRFGLQASRHLYVRAVSEGEVVEPVEERLVEEQVLSDLSDPVNLRHFLGLPIGEPVDTRVSIAAPGCVPLEWFLHGKTAAIAAVAMDHQEAVLARLETMQKFTSRKSLAKNELSLSEKYAGLLIEHERSRDRKNPIPDLHAGKDRLDDFFPQFN
jgi:hypothetical protein